LENFNLYRPTIMHFLVFWKDRKPALKKKARIGLETKITLNENLTKDAKVSEEAEYALIELTKPLSTSEVPQAAQDGVRQVGKMGMLGSGKHSSLDGWIDVEPVNVSYSVRAMVELGKTVVEDALAKNEGLHHLGTYTIISCGTRRNYWLESKIEISGFIKSDKQARKLKEVETKLRIESLSEVITGTKQFHGNSLGITATASTLYGLGSISYRQMENFSEVFLLDTLTDPDEAEGQEATKEKHLAKVENISRLMSKFLYFHSKLSAHQKSEYKDADTQAYTMRQEAMKIQARIFNLQKGATKENVKKDVKYDTKKEASEEEDLLQTTSITFSAITSLEQTIGSNMFMVFNLNKSLEEILEGLDPKKVELPEGESRPIPSLFDEFKRYADSVNLSYQILRDDVNNTQSTLRNSLDVLRTYLEHQQKKVADRQGRTLFIFTLIFAAFGIADALSNLLAYYLTDRTLEGAIWTALAFTFSIAVSMLGFGIIYWALIKKALG